MSQQDAESNSGNEVIPFQKDSRLLGTGIRTGYTEEWKARRIANSSNTLTMLPGEILLCVMDHLSDGDKFLVARVSFRFRHLASHLSFSNLWSPWAEPEIDRNTAMPTSGGEIAHYIPDHNFRLNIVDTSRQDRTKVESILRSRNTCRPCLEKVTEIRNLRRSNRRFAGKMFCTACQIHHDDSWFSPEQKAWRKKVCLGREGKVRICPHQFASFSTVESWYPALTGKAHTTKVLVCQECASAAEFKAPRVPPTVLYEEHGRFGTWDIEDAKDTENADDKENVEDKENVDDLGNAEYPWLKSTCDYEYLEWGDSESKDTEFEDTEDTELKGPESKDTGFTGFEDPKSEFPDYSEYIDEAGKTEDYRSRRDNEPTLRGELKVQWTATVLTLSEGEILTKEMIRAALKTFNERHKGIICAHASFDFEQLMKPFYWTRCLCFREPSELCRMYHEIRSYHRRSECCFCAKEELPACLGILPASDSHELPAHEHATSCMWCGYQYSWEVDGPQIVLAGYTTALNTALETGLTYWQAPKQAPSHAVNKWWIRLVDPSTVKRDESVRHVEWCDDGNCVYATRALRHAYEHPFP
ncbi:hypothetical protein CMUS01_16243 [Colletotrichum musicola]|uniref:F-box domain-containing protein n=1 Tax=Colletotrichum musicola TaxID=2175873 RepID=A0A8H6IPT8_9PEZI|nr:hypothetical protein CMUS01_16243 [Colletotrichum musicola]